MDPPPFTPEQLAFLQTTFGPRTTVTTPRDRSRSPVRRTSSVPPSSAREFLTTASRPGLHSNYSLFIRLYWPLLQHTVTLLHMLVGMASPSLLTRPLPAPLLHAHKLPKPPLLCNSGLLCKALACCYTCCCLAPLPWHLLHKSPAVGDLPGCFVTVMKGQLWGYRHVQCRCAASYG